MKFILPVILIGAAIVGVVMFINPMYAEINALRAQAASYDEALNNSKALEEERDKLTTKYNSIPASDLERLSKLLPNNVDNIRLILEIEKIAGPFSMVLRDVKYNVASESSSQPIPGMEDQTSTQAGGYGSWDLEFSTQGTYDNFINFVKALETNLRIVDISSVEFSSAPVQGQSGSSSNIYKYLFKIKTYWLKD